MRDIPTSPRILEIKHKRRIQRIRFSVVFFLFIITVCFACSFYSFNPRININKIKITGTHIVDENEIRESIDNNLHGKYLYIFSKSNSFIYPKGKIYSDLINNFTRIESLSVNLDGLNTLIIDIKERDGSYLYCGVEVPKDKSEIGENCYFINNDGYIFDKAPYFSGNVYFKYYVDIKNNNPLGKYIMETNHFHNTVRLIDGIRGLGFNVIYLVMREDGVNSLYLNFENGNTSPVILFKDDMDFDTLLNNLTLSMGKKEFVDEINTKYNKLLYIDLRFKNKVLYKFE